MGKRLFFDMGKRTGEGAKVKPEPERKDIDKYGRKIPLFWQMAQKALDRHEGRCE